MSRHADEVTEDANADVEDQDGHLFNSGVASVVGAGRNFRVVVRVRPISEAELASNCKRCVKIDSKSAINVFRHESQNGERPSTAAQNHYTFVYDRVFGEETAQRELYMAAVQPVVLSSLEGYNGSIIAYGQTGTGKTFTIEGSSDGDNRGIIPLTADDIFQRIQDCSDTGSQYLVRVSFLQIYNEKIYDLLSETSKDSLRIRETGDGGVFVDQLSEHVVKNKADIYQLLQTGKLQRTTNSTKMNRESSRSHAVFTIVIEHSKLLAGSRVVTVAKLNLVDLAGSERFESIGSEKQQRETQNINTSLSAFGKVILSLTSRTHSHVPYRDSKLTRILMDSLGGNCRTTLITTISPVENAFLESVSSLKFANRAKSVKNVAVVNEDKSDSAMLSSYQTEIKKLRALLSEKASTSIDRSEFERLQEQSRMATMEKTVIVTELAKRQREAQRAIQEKGEYEERIKDLEAMLLNGGQAIEATDAFQDAVMREKERMKQEQESEIARLEDERKRLEEEKAQFELMRKQFSEEAALFEKQKTEMLLSEPAPAIQVPIKAKRKSKSKKAKPIDLSEPNTEAPLKEKIDSVEMPAVALAEPSLVADEAALQSDPPPLPVTQVVSEPPAVVPQETLLLTESTADALETSTFKSPRPPSDPPRPSPSGQAFVNRITRKYSRGSMHSDTEQRISVSSLTIPEDEQFESKDSSPQPQPPPPRLSLSPVVEHPVKLVSRASIASTTSADITTPASALNSTTHNIIIATSASATVSTNSHQPPVLPAPPPLRRRQTSDKFLESTDDHQTSRNEVADATKKPSRKSSKSSLLDSPSDSSDSDEERLQKLSTQIKSTRAMAETNATEPRWAQASSWSPDREASSSRVTASAGSQDDYLNQYAQALMDPMKGIPVGRRRVRLTTYNNCFSGTDACGWFMVNMEGITTIDSAQLVGQSLMDLGLITNVKGEKIFEASDQQLYQFRPRASSGVSRDRKMLRHGSHLSLASARSSVSSMMSFSTAFSADTPTSEDFLDDFGSAKSIIHIAAMQNDVAGLKSSIGEFGIDMVDENGRTPLMYAVIANKGKSTRYLLKHGANVNIQDDSGNSALLWASCRGGFDAIKILLAHGADISQTDNEGRTVLHWATKLNSSECLRYLLQHSFRALVNKSDNEHLTALHWAAQGDHASHMQLLLEHDSSPLAIDAIGRTPLHYCVSTNALNCMQILLEFQSDVLNIADQLGRTALHLSCSEGSVDSVRFLLAAPGVDVNATDQRLTAPLHWAAVCNRPEVCQMLQQRGARLMARDYNGMTPLHYAMQKNFHECATILQRFGGSNNATSILLDSRSHSSTSDSSFKVAPRIEIPSSKAAFMKDRPK